MKALIKFLRKLAVVLFIVLAAACDKGDDSENPNPIVETAEVVAVRIGPVDDFSGECPKTFDFEGEIEVDGPMSVQYTWVRSDDTTVGESTVNFEAAGTKTVTTSWSFGESGGSYENSWMQLKVTSPTELLSNRAEFDLLCDFETGIEVTSIIPVSPDTLIVGERVEFEFNYTTNEASGVRIFGRPLTMEVLHQNIRHTDHQFIPPVRDPPPDSLQSAHRERSIKYGFKC